MNERVEIGSSIGSCVCENARCEQWHEIDSLRSLHGGYSSFRTRMDGPPDHVWPEGNR